LALVVLVAGVIEVARTQAALRHRAGRTPDLPGIETAVVTTFFLAGVTLVTVNLTLSPPPTGPPPTPHAQQSTTVLPLDGHSVLRLPLDAPAKAPPPVIGQEPAALPPPGAFVGHAGPVSCVAFSPDGAMALSGSA